MPANTRHPAGPPDADAWDNSTRQEFFDYYAKESESEAARQRFRNITDAVQRVRAAEQLPAAGLAVLDVGCGAGTLSMMWAGMGHQVHGVDINAPLVELAGERAASAGHDIDFRVGSATALPWPDNSMDVCLVPELLEHVVEWQTCLDEFARVLRPNGTLFLSTTNKLCPKQQEFDLPLYSWYPAPLKRHCEHLARTSRPQIAGYATYPAVNWFSFYSLRRELARRGFRSKDRFDALDTAGAGAAKRLVVNSIRSVPPLRWLAHVFTPFTQVVAIKSG